ncbi:MAG TPA: hypothetical protein VLF21_00680 [Candidatus Saccharimonadales bacterium]|nr:hypothetical protein [Candidatus Saccharimonadales bacterium]
MPSLATIVPSLVGGSVTTGGILGIAAKKAKDDADGKKSCFRMPYGHESVMTRFGMPLHLRTWYWDRYGLRAFGPFILPCPIGWDPARRQQLMIRTAGQWFKLPFIHKQPPTDMRPQKHECQELKIVTRDCVAFKVTPVIHFQVVDVAKKQLEMSSWSDYLYEGIVQVIQTDAGKITYRQLIRGLLDKRIITKAREIGGIAGIRVDDVGFKCKQPTGYGEVVVSREALADASACALNKGVGLLDDKVLTAPAAVVASLLGPPVVTTSVGMTEADETEVASTQAAEASANVKRLRLAQGQ